MWTLILTIVILNSGASVHTVSVPHVPSERECVKMGNSQKAQLDASMSSASRGYAFVAYSCMDMRLP